MLISIFKYFVLIFGFILFPKEDLENKLNKLNKDEILLKNKSAGANATGKKLNFPEKINNKPIATIKKIMKYFLYSLNILFPKKKINT